MTKKDLIGRTIVRVDGKGIPITIEDNVSNNHITINGISEKVEHLISFINAGMYGVYQLTDI